MFVNIGQWSVQVSNVFIVDEGLNSPCDKNVSAALWKISDDYLPSMRKAVLSISGNVYKQQEMEIDAALSEIESKYDFT
jgi:hypothetical protein